MGKLAIAVRRPQRRLMQRVMYSRREAHLILPSIFAISQSPTQAQEFRFGQIAMTVLKARTPPQPLHQIGMGMCTSLDPRAALSCGTIRRLLTQKGACRYGPIVM